MRPKAIIFLFIVALAHVSFISAAPKKKPATGCGAIQIISRMNWGVSSRPGGNTLTVPVNYVFIHHTDGPVCTTQASCSGIIKGIYNRHTKTNKWPDIGYNFLIGGDGRVYEGRGWDKEGTHTNGWDSRSVGISFIGNYASKVPSTAMQNAAKNLILCGVSKRKISSSYGVYPHRDGYCTSCPGSALYNALRSWPNYKKHGTIQKFCSAIPIQNI